MISLSQTPQFDSEDIQEIHTGIERTVCEFEKDLVKVCHSLFPFCRSNDALAKELFKAKIIARGDIDASTTDAVIVRFRSRKYALSFISRLNSYLRRRYKEIRVSEERERRLLKKMPAPSSCRRKPQVLAAR
jgi:hypothetical protein